MGSFGIGATSAILAFVAGVAGLYLGANLPEKHSIDRARDMIGSMAGLFSLLLALVLGTLVGNAYGFYATQKSEMETLSSRIVQLDIALAEYGPETAPIRAGLKHSMQLVYEMIWGKDADSEEGKHPSLVPALAPLRLMDVSIASLNPQTPAQRQFATTASIDASVIEQTRILISLQLASPVSWPLIFIVVSWALILFCGYGLLSKFNGTTIVALALGSFAVGSAVFLILVMSEPFTGIFRIPSGAIEQTLAALGAL
jgi:hypothetical protein